MKKELKLLPILAIVCLCSCGNSGNGNGGTKIPNDYSKVSGGAAQYASISKDEPSLYSIKQADDSWTIVIKVPLKNEATLSFGDFFGSSLELCILDENGNKVGENFMPGESSDDIEDAYDKLMKLMTSPAKTVRTIAFNYKTDDEHELNELKGFLAKSKGVEILDFDFFEGYAVLKEDGTIENNFIVENEPEPEPEPEPEVKLSKYKMPITFSEADLPKLDSLFEYVYIAKLRYNGGYDQYKELKEKALQGDGRSVIELKECLAVIHKSHWYDTSLYREESKIIFELVQIASSMGDPMGLYEMGACYADGIGVVKDLEKAVEYFEQCLEYDVAKAYYALGGCYENGWGVQTNRRKAAEYYHEAFNLGIDEAQARWLHCLN